MKRFLLLAFATVCCLGSAVHAGPEIEWGQPVNGLRLGVESGPATTTSDQELTFTVAVQNVSNQRVFIPAPNCFVEPA